MGRTDGGEARWVRSAAWASMCSAVALTLVASPAAGFDAQLGWTPVQSVAGYRVYTRQNGQVYGAGIDIGLLQAGSDGVVRYVDPGLPTGILTYFAVTAYDGSGRESALSNELSVLVTSTPAPTSTPPASATRSLTPPPAPPTATPRATSTQTLQPSSTAAATPTRSATATPTATVPPTASPPPTGSPTPTATPIPTQAVVWAVSIPTDAHAKPGLAVSVPIRIASGSNIRQLAVDVAFDPSVVAIQSAQLATTAGLGTLVADFATPGELAVSAALTQPMTAGGAVVNVFFTAVGACHSATALQITSCVLDGGAVGCQPSDGHIAVRCGHR